VSQWAGAWALVATQLPSIGVLIWGWRHLTLLRKVVSLISSVQELHMLWISLNIFTPGLRDLEGEKHTQNLQYYILWYHYPSHRVGWNYLLNPIDRPASHESSKLLEHTHGSSPQRQNRYKPAWNILKPCWPVLNHVASPFYKWDSSSWIDRKRKAGLSL